MSKILFLCRISSYCKGFDQHVARQQLCKHGSTRNNRGSCVFCRSDRHASRLADIGHVKCLLQVHIRSAAI
jgi:hypothetical protein